MWVLPFCFLLPLVLLLVVLLVVLLLLLVLLVGWKRFEGKAFRENVVSTVVYWRLLGQVCGASIAFRLIYRTSIRPCRQTLGVTGLCRVVDRVVTATAAEVGSFVVTSSRAFLFGRRLLV